MNLHIPFFIQCTIYIEIFILRIQPINLTLKVFLPNKGQLYLEGD